MAPTFTKVRTLRDATAAGCRDCDWTADICHPYWGLGKLRGLHLGGSGKGHRVDLYAMDGVTDGGNDDD